MQSTLHSTVAAHSRRRVSGWSRFADLLTVRRQRNHLAALDDHLLRDIGLTRYEAEVEAGRPVWDAPASWRQR